MIIKKLKQIIKPKKQKVETQTSLLEKKAEHFQRGYTGTVPAPPYLKEDEWFDRPVFSEKQLEIRAQLEEENQLIPLSEDQSPKEVDNIHEVMYNIATSGGKTTTQLNPMPELGGGSENFQSGPGGWMSGTGLNQFHQGR